jgi:hypothetical protein
MSARTPKERSLLARVAACERWAREDGVAGTEKARAKSPGQLAYWHDKVDPDRVLDEAERARRAESARKAHFTRLALASARARRMKAS